MAQMVKNLPVGQDSGVQSLGWKDPLEKGMAIHSSIFAWLLSLNIIFSRLIHVVTYIKASFLSMAE